MPISPALAITGSYRRSFTIQTAKISFCAIALICDARSRKTPSASSSILASASVKPDSSTLVQVLLGDFLPVCADVGKVRSSRITSPRKSKIMSYRATKESGTEPARRSCYNKAHDLEHGFHTPALLGES